MASQSRGPEIHPYLRVVIITLRLFCTKDWRDISSKTGIKEDTAYRIWTRTVKCAGTDTDLLEILAHISTLDRSGRPECVVDGTPESERIRKLLLDYPYSTFQEVIDQENLPYARSTIEKIAKEHSSTLIPRPIVRKTQQNKCYLDAADHQLRLKFCDWALKEIENGAIFIFVDESYISFGGVRQKQSSLYIILLLTYF
jgi:hypothetical protein